MSCYFEASSSSLSAFATRSVWRAFCRIPIAPETLAYLLILPSSAEITLMAFLVSSISGPISTPSSSWSRWQAFTGS